MPDWDGKSESLRVYKSRVHIYTVNSKTAKCRQVGKLLERLKGDAVDKTERLDPASLKHDGGASMLIFYLESKYETIEAIKIGTLCDEDDGFRHAV